MSLLAFFALRVLARCTIARALEVHIALPSRPAATKDEFLTVMREVDNWLHVRLRIVVCGKIGIRIVFFCIRRRALGVGYWTFSIFCFNLRCSFRSVLSVYDRSNRLLNYLLWHSTHVQLIPLSLYT